MPQTTGRGILVPAMSAFEQLAGALRFLRERRGLTQRQLADAIESPLKQINAYENGRQRPRIETLERILAAVGADAMDLSDVMAGLAQAVDPVVDVADAGEVDVLHRIRGDRRQPAAHPVPLLLGEPVLRVALVSGVGEQQRHDVGGVAGGGPGAVPAGGNPAGGGTAVVTTDLMAQLVGAGPLTPSVPSWPAGGTASYVLQVSNLGPNAAPGASLVIPAATGLSKTGAQCYASGGAACPPGGVSVGQLEGGVVIPSLPAGATMQIAFSASVTAPAGSNVSVTAALNVPAGVSDLDPRNNTSTQVQSIVAASAPAGSGGAVADLSFSFTSQRQDLPAGTAVRHLARVRNSGPAAVSQATLQVPPFANMSKPGTLTCRSSDGSACALNGVPTDRLSAGLSLPTLPAGAALEVEFDLTLNGTPGDPVRYEGFVSPPAGITDPDLSNNATVMSGTLVAPPPSLTVIPFIPTATAVGTPGGTVAAPTQPVAPPVTTVPPATSSGAASVPNSGVYLVTVTGIICALPTADTTMTGLIQVGDPDGRGDEVQAAAYVRRFDRATQQLLEQGNRRSIPYGDITAGTGRLQAGTQTPTGGVRHGDFVPPNLSVARASAAQDLAFPWKVWEGRLTDGVDVLMISPGVWEWDGRQDFYAKWVDAQRLFDQTILADAGVQSRIANQSLAPVEAGTVAYFGGGDRPIGLRRTGNGSVVPNVTIVLTREIIERALTANSWAPTQIPVTGVPLTIPKPGILVLNFTEVGSDPLSMPASYSLILQVEKVGN